MTYRDEGEWDGDLSESDAYREFVMERLAARERELEQRRQWVKACQRQERENPDG